VGTMAGCVAILHGWSDEGKSFQPLRQFLVDHGYDAREVFLGDYISLDDDVRVEDVAKRMEDVVAGLMAAGQLAPTFDLIVHSTGALVARQWLLDRHNARKPIPVKRLVMLAPANFGSKLAAVGKSMIGRLTKGLENHLQTGEQMLRALELASPYQWNLSRQDLLVPPGGTDASGPFAEGGVLPFVIIGTRAYDSGLQQIVNEDGSDGTVRVCAGNLNAVGLTIDFTPLGAPPTVQVWGSRMARPAPLAVLPERDHSEITHPEQDGDAAGDYGRRLGRLILEALACDDLATYEGIELAWRRLSNETALLALGPEEAAAQAPLEDPPVPVPPPTIAQVFGDRDHPKPDHFHRYLQLVVMVRDDYGNFVDDYFLEFAEPRAGDEKSTITFHRDVLEGVHNNSISPAFRCLYIDHTDLIQVFYDDNTALAASLTAARPGRNIGYFDAAAQTGSGQILLHASDVGARSAIPGRLRRNQTHFIEVIVPRRPVDKVFAFLPQDG
ncbi:MAG TPA: hypothetical protein VFH92_10315, partial [Phenylobacterium sp.]|nr:hypothetical protein [Phenylobacterium sp.]